jgi:sugar lactone lactonase YvrE
MRRKIIILISILFWSCDTVNDTSALFYKLNTEILPADAGSINLEKGEYKFNTVRTIHAKPNEGWLFDHWEGIISGLSNPTDIIFYGDHDIRAVFVKDTFRVRTLAGGKGKGFNLDQFNYPTGIAYDQDENLYVSDMHNHRIQKWIKGATFGITIAGGNDYGSDANQLNEPGKIAIDALGTIYVADSENNRIQKWYKGAKEGETVAGGNGRGDGLNQFDKPYGIALDNDGILYVSDIENHRVVRWDPNAKEGVVVAGGNGNGNELNQLSYPMGIILDEKKNLYVADTYNHRVQLWNPGAKEGVTILSADDINFKSFNFFTGITIDKKNRLYLSDYEKRQVVEFDMASESIKIVAGGNKVGPGPNQFSDPFQIVSKTDDFILVADAKNNRIQKWRLN